MQIRRGMIAVVAVLALGACGDDDDDSAATTTPATTVAPATQAPATTVAATTAPSTNDAQLAQSALLTITDMPTGWTESPVGSDDDEEDAANVQRISDCSGLDATLIGDGVLGDTKAESPEFSSTDGLASVKHTVGFAPDDQTAIDAIAAIGDDALAPCYEQAMQASFDEAASTTDPSATLVEGMTLTDISMERIDPPVPVTADDAVWYSATATLDYQGQPIEIHLDLLFTRTGRVLSQLEFDGTTTEFPQELVEPTVSAAQAKVDAVATA